MTTETAQQIVPPSPVAPSAPSTSRWALYVYGTHAYLAFDGRLIATATVATPRQEARIRALFARLTVQRTRRA